MNDGPKRKAIPDSIKLAACLIAAGVPAEAADPSVPLKRRIATMLIVLLGPDHGPVEWDHNPALALRPIRADGKDWEPGQHNPAKIVPLRKAAHLSKTTGRLGESKLSITGNGDTSRASKVKRLTAEPEKNKPKRAWPKRPLRSRNNLRRK